MRKMHERPGEHVSVVFSRRISHGQLRRPSINGPGSVSPGWQSRNESGHEASVIQLERTRCGIASVAALAGMRYPLIQCVANRHGIVADNPKLWSEIGYVRRLLREFEIRPANTEVRLTSWGPCRISRCSPSNGTKNGIVRSGIGWCFGEGLAGLLCSTRSVNSATMSAPETSGRMKLGKVVHSC